MNVTHHLRLAVAVWLLSLLALLSLVLGVGALAEAKALFVANNGLDSNTCLDKDHPCRTIGKAIQNANSGDKIVVGPGHYTWESESEPGPSSCSFRCVIKVDKQLTIESRDGAGATVLDATGHNVDVVRIEASGVVFGKKNKGFTLTGAGGGSSGLVITDGTSGVKVSGNLAIRNSGQGFTFSGSGHLLVGNIASANFFGFSVIGSGHILTGNIASSNSYGFGFSGNGHLLSGDTASANRFTGFIFSGSGHLLTNNTASANGFHGFDVNDGSGYVLTGNSAVGNKFFGIDIRKSASATITKNNIFGNDSQPSGSFVNCGLLNQSGGTINATNNFWGAAAGPGADPADNICNDGMGSNTTVAPFATKEFKAKSQSVSFLEESAPLAPAASGGKTLFVANNGLDIFPSGFCGDKDHPCRSISQAINFAVAGDHIIVGPGRYGDLDGDGTLGSSIGEENPAGGAISCKCMIRVHKSVTIESRDGAGDTVLDAGGINVDVVRIEASGVVFGKKNKGFTLTHAGGSGFRGLFIAASTSGVRVTGNLATANGEGFEFSGSGHVFSDNLASANGHTGFFIRGSRNVLSGNIASANGGDGFDFRGSGHVLHGNIASANGNIGFEFGGNGHMLSGNLASANGLDGFFFEGSGHQLTGNAAVGNERSGIFIGDSGSTESATITKNNIFGNNNNDVITPGFRNCGLFNGSKDSIVAPNNFWGVADGPGTLASPKPEPADNVCDDPGAPGSSTTVDSFATKEFKVRTTAFLDELGLVVPADSEQNETPPTASVSTQFLKELQTKEGLLFRAAANVSALRLEVSDLSGRTIYDSGFVKGQELSWTHVNAQNKPIASGVYLYRLTARDREGREIQSELRKLIILK